MTNVEKRTSNSNFKRRLASVEGCLIDLKDELPLIFRAFEKACKSYNNEVVQTPPEARCRGFEAALLNSKLIHGIQLYFPDSWRYGKYRRFVLYKNGYLILFKKLNSKGMPMNIRTKFVESINSQMMSSLFEHTDYVEDPILYFGYKKDRLGNIIQPQLVYIDENQVKWALEEKDVFLPEVNYSIEKPAQEKASPKLRRTKRRIVNE